MPVVPCGSPKPTQVQHRHLVLQVETKILKGTHFSMQVEKGEKRKEAHNIEHLFFLDHFLTLSPKLAFQAKSKLEANTCREESLDALACC